MKHSTEHEHPVMLFVRAGYEMQIDPAIIAFLLWTNEQNGRWDTVEAAIAAFSAGTGKADSLPSVLPDLPEHIEPAKFC